MTSVGSTTPSLPGSAGDPQEAARPEQTVSWDLHPVGAPFCHCLVQPPLRAPGQRLVFPQPPRQLHRHCRRFCHRQCYSQPGLGCHPHLCDGRPLPRLASHCLLAMHQLPAVHLRSALGHASGIDCGDGLSALLVPWCALLRDLSCHHPGRSGSVPLAASAPWSAGSSKLAVGLLVSRPCALAGALAHH